MMKSIEDEEQDIFNIINEIQNLKFEKQKSSESNGKNYGDLGSLNQEECNGTSSFEYFRNSSGIISKNDDYDNYFDDVEEFEHTMISKNSFRPQDFFVLSTIGKGAYAKVALAKLKKTGVLYAIKIFEKKWMEKENKKYHIYVENDILNSLSHSNIINIYGSYEDSFSIYLVLEYCSKAPLKVDLIKYFSAQIILSIEYMSNLGIIHRDIKPDNYVIDKQLQLKLVDFSTATYVGKIWDESNYKFTDIQEFFKTKKDSTSDSSANDSNSFKRLKRTIKESDKEAILIKQNFVGTAEYMAPEIITNKEIGIFTDLWSFGCILFQFFMGHSPFRDKTEYLTFQNILNLNYSIDPKIVPEDAKDLIEKLLKIDPKERIGSGLSKENSLEKLKNHKFFKNFGTKNYFEIIEIYLKKSESQRVSIITSIENIKEVSKSEIILKDKKEKIVKIGELKKKSPWLFYDKRKIILYDTPRLDYFDPNSNILKGSISLMADCRAELKSKTSFDLITPNRTYHFLCKSKYDISPWVTAINETIQNHNVE